MMQTYKRLHIFNPVCDRNINIQTYIVDVLS